MSESHMRPIFFFFFGAPVDLPAPVDLRVLAEDVGMYLVEEG